METHPRTYTQLELFQTQLPDNLYRNHYTLNEIYPSYAPEEWRSFLREHDHFIRTETSAITEAEARSALQKLTKGNAKSADISAIKQLLEQSEQMNQRTKDQRTFVVTNMPDYKKTKTVDELRYDLVTKNNEIAKTFYGVRHVNDITQAKQNADGTLHFPSYKNDLDEAYLRVFNPENEYLDRLPEIDRGDVQ